MDAMSKIKIYPNPAENTIHIESDLVSQKIHIINQLGQIIVDTKTTNNSVDVSQLTPGVYTVKVYFTETSIVCTKKIVKI